MGAACPYTARVRDGIVHGPVFYCPVGFFDGIRDESGTKAKAGLTSGGRIGIDADPNEDRELSGGITSTDLP